MTNDTKIDENFAPILDKTLYDLYTPTKRFHILIVCGAIAILTPFTDTIYLPALVAVSKDFHTTDALVALTISIYLGIFIN